VESYQSLFLKAHYPLEFMVGVINNFGGFYPSWVYFNEAKNWGAKIHPPCVNRGEYKTCISGNDVYVGFVHINGMETHVGKVIQPERQRGGEYLDMDDFIHRVPAPLEQLIILVRAGAFRFTGKPKALLLWEVHMLMGRQNRGPQTGNRFTVPGSRFPGPPQHKQGTIPRCQPSGSLRFTLTAFCCRHPAGCRPEPVQCTAPEVRTAGSCTKHD
jgi:DNA polymerase III alpha subunit